MTELILAAQGQAQGAGGGWGFIVMMVLIFAIMWWFMIRPQQKRQKEIRKFQNALSEGTKVVTGGGIYGSVKRIDPTSNKVDVEIARGVVITVDKNYLFADSAQQLQNR